VGSWGNYPHWNVELVDRLPQRLVLKPSLYFACPQVLWPIFPEFLILESQSQSQHTVVRKDEIAYLAAAHKS
jgi:hypothetical protein